MGRMLESLRKLQGIETRLQQVRSRLRTRQNAVRVQQKRIDALQEEIDALGEQKMNRRKLADEKDLDLKQKEEEVTRLRAVLNAAKSNKEYAAILTQINTLKADSAKIEEESLKTMEEVDALTARQGELDKALETERGRLEEVKASTGEEIAKLDGMREQLEAQRAEATSQIAPEALKVFERIAGSHDGEAMAEVQAMGKKPPYSYVCGGCYMSLNAEHANALHTRDEIRQCDNCGRILYLPDESTVA